MYNGGCAKLTDFSALVSADMIQKELDDWIGHSVIHLFIKSFIFKFIHLFVYPLIRSFIYLFTFLVVYLSTFSYLFIIIY